MGERRYYEIVNPSDRVTICSDNEVAACVAVLLISNGAFGLRRCDDDVAVLPILAFGGRTRAEEWVRGHGIEDLAEGLDAFISENRIAMSSALESVFYGNAKDARALELTLDGLDPSDAAARRAKYNDQRRTSLTNIEAAALAYAAKLRKLEAEHGR